MRAGAAGRRGLPGRHPGRDWAGQLSTAAGLRQREVGPNPNGTADRLCRRGSGRRPVCRWQPAKPLCNHRRGAGRCARWRTDRGGGGDLQRRSLPEEAGDHRGALSPDGADQRAVQGHLRRRGERHRAGREAQGSVPDRAGSRRVGGGRRGGDRAERAGGLSRHRTGGGARRRGDGAQLGGERLHLRGDLPAGLQGGPLVQRGPGDPAPAGRRRERLRRGGGRRPYHAGDARLSGPREPLGGRRAVWGQRRHRAFGDRQDPCPAVGWRRGARAGRVLPGRIRPG